MTSCCARWMLLLAVVAAADFCFGKMDEAKFSCKTDDECSTRFGRWKAYRFVCCTSVMCDENYGDYYIATSGCAIEKSCKPKVSNNDNGTTFAARMLTSTWLTVTQLSADVLDDCPKTRAAFTQKAIEQIEAKRVVVPLPPKTAISLIAPDLVRDVCTAKEDDCRAQGKQCCLQISCHDLPAFDPKYTTTAVCRSQCRTTLSTRFSELTFIFHPDTWARRKEYSDDQFAPDPHKHCGETRFFYYWLRTPKSSLKIV